MMIHQKDSLVGDSFLYFFAEKDYIAQSQVFFKIGIVTHAKTDEGIKNWKKYTESPTPPSITRRILKLQNGNPRQIIPLAYFRYTSHDSQSGKSQSQKVETRWKRAFRQANCKTPSPEWFTSCLAALVGNIYAVAEAEAGKYAGYWMADEIVEMHKQLG